MGDVPEEDVPLLKCCMISRCDWTIILGGSSGTGGKFDVVRARNGGNAARIKALQSAIARTSLIDRLH